MWPCRLLPWTISWTTAVFFHIGWETAYCKIMSVQERINKNNVERVCSVCKYGASSCFCGGSKRNKPHWTSLKPKAGLVKLRLCRILHMFGDSAWKPGSWEVIHIPDLRCAAVGPDFFQAGFLKLFWFPLPVLSFTRSYFWTSTLKMTKHIMPWHTVAWANPKCT